MTVHLAEAELREYVGQKWITLRNGMRVPVIRGGSVATGDAMTTFAANELIDHLFSAATYTPPANITCALFTAAPSDAGGGTEVTGGAYARISQTNNATNWPAASGGSKSNGTAINFGTATANWGTVTHVALFDGSTNMLLWGALTTSRIVNNGDSFQFAATKLVIAFT